MTAIRRYFVGGYSLLAYLVFLASLLYGIGFLANIGVPKGIDEGPGVPLIKSLTIDVALLGLFAVQHSVMARSWFKKRLTRIIPEPAERSTYVLFSSLTLFALYLWWQPMTTEIWTVTGVVAILIWSLYVLGWLIAVSSTFLIDHSRLFGLRQAYAYLQGKDLPPQNFQIPGFYRYVRHPLLAGFLLAFWSTPQMTAGHLLFAIATTGYIVIGAKLEERVLVNIFGDTYRQYRQDVPMFIPRPGRTASSTSDYTDDT